MFGDWRPWIFFDISHGMFTPMLSSRWCCLLQFYTGLPPENRHDTIPCQPSETPVTEKHAPLTFLSALIARFDHGAFDPFAVLTKFFSRQA